MKLITQQSKKSHIPKFLYKPDEIERDFVFVFSKQTTDPINLLMIKYLPNDYKFGFSYHFNADANTVQVDYIEGDTIVKSEQLLCNRTYRFRIVFYPEINTFRLSIQHSTRTMLKLISSVLIQHNNHKKLCYFYEFTI